MTSESSNPSGTATDAAKLPISRVPAVASGERSTAIGEAGSRTKPIQKAIQKPKHAKLELSAEKEEEYQPLRCPDCKRANPTDAFYCHYDGKPLFKDLQPTALKVGNLAFPSPFCFTTGQACTNFNQLALTCNHRWDEARDLLAQGIWSTFFSSMGRLDLAAAAKEAAKLPDPDRGLSQFLERLPADPEFLKAPKLVVSPAEINLGDLKPGIDTTFDLVIRNEGMLFLHGIVLSNYDWLVFADQVKPLGTTPTTMTVHSEPSQAHPDRARTHDKIFQTKLGCAIPVRVLGNKLRAGLKALQGEIIIDTNGGAVTVPVKANVPVAPFPTAGYSNDVLAGVKSPRHLAARAKRMAKEAGALFEEGAVRAWYASNGWTYPIDGPEGVGAGALQQFFEVLGLTAAPRLEIDTTDLVFEARNGDALVAYVTVQTKDRKPVFANAWSDQPWIQPGPSKCLGPQVKIPLNIVVPPTAGKTVQATITIVGNGKQRFTIPVAITVKKR
jgi:hypothetical protein